MVQPLLGGALTERCHERKEEDRSTMEMPTLGVFVCMVWFQKLCRRKQNKNVNKKNNLMNAFIHVRHVQVHKVWQMAKNKMGKWRYVHLTHEGSRRVITVKRHLMTVRVFSWDPNPVPPLVHFTAVHLLYSALISPTKCKQETSFLGVCFRTCSLNFSSFSNCSLWFFSSCSISFWCFMASCRHSREAELNYGASP